MCCAALSLRPSSDSLSVPLSTLRVERAGESLCCADLSLLDFALCPSLYTAREEGRGKPVLRGLVAA